MRATKKLYQVLLVKNEKANPSRYFQNEGRAQNYCKNFNQILSDQSAKAIYQEIQIPQSTPINSAGHRYNQTGTDMN